MKFSEVYQTRYTHFLERLRQTRLDANLSQEEVAQKLGISQSIVSRSENGDRRVDVIELLTFAELYRKPLEFFTD
ncbi:hypothetical protein Hgul01_00549 [Herpetosiphon gulosus]|uniref:HTH cro/C1-type domain-containing protein n=1 Tax=Herpetosiphon gulosus TaxID=1973496 RepID=A0ABP9WUD0_9CHLR